HARRIAAPRGGADAAAGTASTASTAAGRRIAGRCTPPSPRLLVCPQQVARDDEPLDLRRALVDPEGPDRAVEVLDRTVDGDAAPAEELDGVVDDPLGRLGGEGLGHTGLHGDPLGAAVLLPRGAVDEEARRVEGGGAGRGARRPRRARARGRARRGAGRAGRRGRGGRGGGGGGGGGAPAAAGGPGGRRRPARRPGPAAGPAGPSAPYVE